MIVSWFSAGVSSAVATVAAKRALGQCPVWPIYIDIDDQHPDTSRFVHDCGKWFHKEGILPGEVLISPLRSVENCCLVAAFIRGPHGAACTNRLKKRVRKEWEHTHPGSHTYIWGFGKGEEHRADGVRRAMPKHDHMFPILGNTKAEIHGILAEAGIKRPAMYEMGYPNNNCIGCVKGGMGYWNKIRVDFPDVFSKRAAMERKIGGHILKECYLDELDPGRGRLAPLIVPDCGIFCEIEDARAEAAEAQGTSTNKASHAIALEDLEPFAKSFNKSMLNTVCSSEHSVVEFVKYVKSQRQA
jgi:hypothetical protein